MLKLFISKSICLDEKEVTIFAILNGLYSNKFEYVCTSIIQIAYMISGRWIDTRNKDRRLYNNIKSGIHSLIERNIITLIDRNNDDYIISSKGLEVDTGKEKFTVVELWELQKIFSESNKPFNVFAFFVNLVGTINNQTKEWHMSQDEMAVNWGCSKRTVNDYMEQLERMQLIYVYRHRKRRADGTYQKINNSYGRYVDKKAVIIEALGYADTIECEEISRKIDRRSIKLRYNAFCDGAKRYKDNSDAISDLYNECLLYNDSLKVKPIDGTYNGEWKQVELLDLSVFPSAIESENSQWGEPDSLSVD